MADHYRAFTNGNAIKDGKRGWFVGQFIPPSLGLAHQQALEIKWDQHAKGERRRAWAKSLNATTISILVNGAFMTRLKAADETQEILLSVPGDYVAFGPGVDHAWEALDNSLVITVRFPSLKNDQIEAQELDDGG